MASSLASPDPDAGEDRARTRDRSGSTTGLTIATPGRSTDESQAGLAQDEAICILDPIKHTGYRTKISGVDVVDGYEPATAPLRVELTDGTIWGLRSGGTGGRSPEDLTVYYWCYNEITPACANEALWGDQSPFEVEGDTWVARRAGDNEMTEPVEVARVWFVTP